MRGRLAVMTLAAAHDDPADPRARAAVLLKSAGRLSAEDARRLRWLDAFGALIANTDRHPYNVAFFTEGTTLRLAHVRSIARELSAVKGVEACQKGKREEHMRTDIRRRHDALVRVNSVSAEHRAL